MWCLKPFLFSGLLFPVSAWSYQLPVKPVSMQVKDAGVRDILEFMLNESGTLFEIEETISNSSKMSVSAQNEKWETLFQKILAQSRLTYNFDDSGRIVVLEK